MQSIFFCITSNNVQNQGAEVYQSVVVKETSYIYDLCN